MFFRLLELLLPQPAALTLYNTPIATANATIFDTIYDYL